MSENSNLLDELSNISLTMDDLIDAIAVQAPFLSQLEKNESNDDKAFAWSQVGALRGALDIANEAYYSYRSAYLSEVYEWREPVEFGRRLLGKTAASPRSTGPATASTVSLL